MRITSLFLSCVLCLTACDGASNEADVPEASTEDARSKAPEDARSKAKAKSPEPEGEKLPAPPDVAAPPADAQKTTSGLAYKVLQEGPAGGERPTDQATVEVHYTGWTTDGEMFDSSVTRGQTIQFPLTRVIAGWTEGVQLMKVGDRFRFWIPEELAYKGRPGAPAGMLVFDVELIGFKTPPAPPPAPTDVAAPPADAKKTASGLAYKVLKSGDAAGAHPAETDRVKVHYTGWTTDGEMFDSSVPRENPAVFPLNRVIAGWTEGVQLMRPGDQFRFWIPEELAYKGMPGKPAGMLVFDVELLEVMATPARPTPSAPSRPEGGGAGGH